MPVDCGQFTKIPNKLFGSGTARELKPAATLLYLALWENANRHGKAEFKASDKALASETTLSSRTICDARKRLIETGLISCIREPGQSFTYTLPKPEMNWVPLKDRPRKKMLPRAYHAQRAARLHMVPSASANVAEPQAKLA